MDELNAFEKGVAYYIGIEALKTLQQVVIGIAGAGGLGSNCAMNLVRCGFKRFIIADFDVIEPSNLNRQFYFNDQVGGKKVDMLRTNLLAVNPDLDITVFNGRIDGGNIRSVYESCDAVVEAFDAVESKKLLVETFIQTEKLVVSVSGIAGCGDADSIMTRKIKENFYLIGDMKTDTTKDIPPLSPGVSIAAAKQADVVMHYWLSRQSMTLSRACTSRGPIRPPGDNF